MHTHELHSALRSLRLSGVLETLETRNRQAIDGQLAYTEFLALLLQDEIARRDQKKFDTLLHQARFRNHKTLEDFAFDRLPTLNRSLVHDLATGRYLHEKAPVLIVGPCGTGKSHLAQALGHSAVRQGIDVRFLTQSELVGGLHAARATGTYDKVFRQWAKVSLLIIDDFGLKPLRPPHDEDFHDLIAERYEQATTMVTSNLDFSEWGEVFPANRMLGVATLDRLRHGAYRLILEGESYRTPRPLPESPKRTVAKHPKIAQS
ncbi:IS21-like element helper ATPase IstB [Acidithiobacillus sulfuriphilus]|uniref:ATP-binding protein n=3 Tax=Acidithiobacillus sulfuriphilus TaxID=1867749 RepID=A0A3M8SAY8_9PROT|nr:IS21-like element helper ATPase IstB [Acidithiobacillus sulfuriphilus]RNF76856.1 ATP-binding protein [Acidithiobacillus sulfuriphilus]